MDRATADYNAAKAKYDAAESAIKVWEGDLKDTENDIIAQKAEVARLEALLKACIARGDACSKKEREDLEEKLRQARQTLSNLEDYKKELDKLLAEKRAALAILKGDMEAKKAAMDKAAQALKDMLGGSPTTRRWRSADGSEYWADADPSSPGESGGGWGMPDIYHVDKDGNLRKVSKEDSRSDVHEGTGDARAQAGDYISLHDGDRYARIEYASTPGQYMGAVHGRGVRYDKAIVVTKEPSTRGSASAPMGETSGNADGRGTVYSPVK